MGNFFSEPQPINVILKYVGPRTRAIPGFTNENGFTLQYTLLSGYNTVATLLPMTQQHGIPKGNGIIGFTRHPGALSTDMLLANETIRDNETLFIVVL
jgi:hypothetical protein